MIRIRTGASIGKASHQFSSRTYTHTPPSTPATTPTIVSSVLSPDNIRRNGVEERCRAVPYTWGSTDSALSGVHHSAATTRFDLGRMDNSQIWGITVTCTSPFRIFQPQSYTIMTRQEQ
ncbi:hypothetical protein L210DRAFT_3523490 [Boletus edulis BED1]|uniref:Uncharacterized protein n=1 Tax=Boletus edulis BED1 TaxID=1328754 RepID=A0AAD4C637_BOLED|nr:hypothetical protein L210DRAFT_3523490 [Boletus edulis BED1]